MIEILRAFKRLKLALHYSEDMVYKLVSEIQLDPCWPHCSVNILSLLAGIITTNSKKYIALKKN